MADFVLNECNLNEALNDLVHWERFAIHLPNINKPDIDKIKKEEPGSVDEQKLSLFSKWLRVCPNASWDNVISALEEVNEKSLAKETKAKFIFNHGGSKAAASTISHVMVNAAIVGTLQELHDEFLSLEGKVEKNIKMKFKKNPELLMDLVQFIQRHRAYDLESQSIHDIYTFLNAVRHLYTFLDCRLFVSLAHEVRDPVIAKVNQYYDQVRRFMRETAVKDLKGKLDPYHESFQSNSRVKVILTLQDEWETQSIFVVKQLVQSIFYLKNDSDCVWFDVRPGSIVVIFTVPRQLVQQKQIGMKKREFLQLVGVIKLQVGNVCLMQNEKDPMFSFRESSNKAQTTNTEAAIFYWEHFESANEDDPFLLQSQSAPPLSLKAAVIDLTRYLCYFADDVLHISEEVSRISAGVKRGNALPLLPMAYVGQFVELGYQYVEETVDIFNHLRAASTGDSDYRTCKMRLQKGKTHLLHCLNVNRLNRLEIVSERASVTCFEEAANLEKKLAAYKKNANLYAVVILFVLLIFGVICAFATTTMAPFIAVVVVFILIAVLVIVLWSKLIESNENFKNCFKRLQMKFSTASDNALFFLLRIEETEQTLDRLAQKVGEHNARELLREIGNNFSEAYYIADAKKVGINQSMSESDLIFPDMSHISI